MVYRMRVGDYRIGIAVEEDEVEFVRFLHRHDVYRYFRSAAKYNRPLLSDAACVVGDLDEVAVRITEVDRFEPAGRSGARDRSFDQLHAA